MAKFKNRLPLSILGFISAVFMVAMDALLIIVAGIISSLGVEDPLQVTARSVELVINTLRRPVKGIPIWVLALAAGAVMTVVSSFFIGGYFRRRSDMMRQKTYDSNRKSQVPAGVEGARRPEIVGFWRGAAGVYVRSLAVTAVSVVTLIAFVVLSALAIVPTVAIISKNGELKGFTLFLSATLALICIWTILLVFVLIKVYIFGLYKGMVMYAQNFVRKSFNSVNAAFVRRYTDYMQLTVLYLAVRIALAWVCSKYAVWIANAGIMGEIYAIDLIFKYVYIRLMNHVCFGER